MVLIVGDNVGCCFQNPPNKEIYTKIFRKSEKIRKKERKILLTVIDCFQSSVWKYRISQECRHLQTP